MDLNLTHFSEVPIAHKSILLVPDETLEMRSIR